MDCSSFPKCSASICPKDSDSIKNAVWFPSEEICSQSLAKWIKVQRKIKAKAKDSTTCYSLKMLSRNCKIGKAIKGIDPDKEQEAEEMKWLKKHPAKKEVSQEHKAELRERIKKTRSKIPSLNPVF